MDADDCNESSSKFSECSDNETSDKEAAAEGRSSSCGISVSNQGKRLFYDKGGFEYRQRQPSKTDPSIGTKNVVLRCTKVGCYGKAIIDPDLNISRTSEHNHPPPVGKKEARDTIAGAKKLRQDGVPTNRILKEFLNDRPSCIDAYLPTKPALGRRIQRSRGASADVLWPFDSWAIQPVHEIKQEVEPSTSTNTANLHPEAKAALLKWMLEAWDEFNATEGENGRYHFYIAWSERLGELGHEQTPAQIKEVLSAEIHSVSEKKKSGVKTNNTQSENHSKKEKPGHLPKGRGDQTDGPSSKRGRTSSPVGTATRQTGRETTLSETSTSSAFQYRAQGEIADSTFLTEVSEYQKTLMREEMTRAQTDRMRSEILLEKAKIDLETSRLNQEKAQLELMLLRTTNHSNGSRECQRPGN